MLPWTGSRMPTIGIDLGTTNSLVAILTAEGPQTLANELGEHLTPSVVAIGADGALLVGRAAKDRLVVEPDAGKAFFKRDMGTAAAYRFGGRTWTPTECSAAVLDELKRIASMHLGTPVTQAVISVPAYFHDSQRQATMQAARIAGLEVQRIINEPTAAALAFGYRQRDVEAKLLVFDLGGGTFDVTVLEMFSGVIEVKASGGDSRLGGEDYTDLLLAHVLAQHGPVAPEPAHGRLRQVVEVAKRHLAIQDAVTIPVGSREIAITREGFAALTAALTARLRPVVRRCLRDAGLAASDLDDVLLVGGASRMPMVGALIGEDLGRTANASLDPDRVVALGAAVQAALCDNHEAVQDLVLTDVAPHTLGVAVSKELSPGHHQNGFFSPIIERNTIVPCSRVESYRARDPQQDVLEIEIYQGENRLVLENSMLGKMQVKGLRAREGQKHVGEIEVRFSYDMNGILEVEVLILATGVRHARVIECRPGAMSREQIDAAVQRLRPLKLHPRDRLPNRARLERANRLYGELTGAARAALSARVDDFDAALQEQHPERIAATAAVLDSFMAHFFAGEGERQPDPDAPQGA